MCVCSAGGQTLVEAGLSRLSSLSVPPASAVEEDLLNNPDKLENKLANSQMAGSHEVSTSREVEGVATNDGLEPGHGATGDLISEMDPLDYCMFLIGKAKQEAFARAGQGGDASRRPWSVVARMPPPPGITASVPCEERGTGADSGSCEKDRLEALCAKASGLSCCVGMEEEITVSPLVSSLQF